MTIGDLITWLSAHPTVVVATAVALPILVLLLNAVAGERWHRQPWLAMYSVVVYAVCIPGILALTLSIYNFLFNRGDIYDLNILVQVLPIAIMIISLALVRQRALMRDIPGFSNITGLCVTLFALLSLGYFLDRFHLVVFSRLHFGFIALFLVAIPVSVWWVWRRN